MEHKSDYRAVIALTANYGLSYMGLLLVGLLSEPIKRSLTLSDAQIGVLTGVSFGIAFTALILPSARVADRWNRRRALFLCGLVFVAATLLTGLAQNSISCWWHVSSLPAVKPFSTPFPFPSSPMHCRRNAGRWAFPSLLREPGWLWR